MIMAKHEKCLKENKRVFTSLFSQRREIHAGVSSLRYFKKTVYTLISK